MALREGFRARVLWIVSCVGFCALQFVEARRVASSVGRCTGQTGRWRCRLIGRRWKQLSQGLDGILSGEVVRLFGLVWFLMHQEVAPKFVLKASMPFISWSRIRFRLSLGVSG